MKKITIMDYILNEIMGDGGAKKENEFFKELKEFEKQQADLKMPEKNYVVEFNKQVLPDFSSHKLPMKFAADSGTKLQSARKSDFIISENSDFAIKYSKKLNEEIYLSILSEKDFPKNEVVLFSPQINKRFICNSNGEYKIGQYSSFNINEFEFKAIFPFEKIILIKNDGNWTVVSLNYSSSPMIFDVKENNLKLKIISAKELSFAVVQSDKTKDFVNVDNFIIDIPIVLLSEKSSVYLY